MRRYCILLFLALLLAGCATVHRDVPRLPSAAWPHPEETALGLRFHEQFGDPEGPSGFYLLASGLEALSARAGLAENAEHTLDLQYFVLHQDDQTTKLLLQRLLQAADRGVQVRMLIDDLYAVQGDLVLAVLSSHPNIEVRAFNPFQQRNPLGLSRLFEYLGDSDRLNRRMHNKLWIADNAAAIIGGRNLGDEYFDADHATSFSDLDVLAFGPVVQGLSRSFDEYWNSDRVVPIEAIVVTLPAPEQLTAYKRKLNEDLQGFRETDYARALRDIRRGSRLLAKPLSLTSARATVLYDQPVKVPAGKGNESAPPLQSRLNALIQSAEHEVLLISPYFIPSDRGIEVLGALVRRGVRVRVLTNSLASTDVAVVHSGYARTRPRLLAAGVELYEMRPDEPPGAEHRWRPLFSTDASLHAKAVVVDRRRVIVGSMNLDPRSRLLNTEIGVLLESEAIGSAVASLFEEAVRPTEAFRVTLTGSPPETPALAWITEEEGREVRYTEEPAGFWRHFLSGLLGALTPDELL